MVARLRHTRKKSYRFPNSELQGQQEYSDEWYKATMAHRASFASGFSVVIISLAKSVLLIDSLHVLLCTTLASLLAYPLADLTSGVYHWAVDNYGSPQTPIFGSQIESFRNHHRRPWAIAKCGTVGLLYVLSGFIAVFFLPMTLVCNNAVVLGFVGIFGGCVILSLQVHAWAHTPTAELPFLVVVLQNVGIILRWSQHVAHHQPPHNSNYCTLSGFWNPILDKSNAFVAAEVVLFRVLGVRPRSWSDSKELAPRIG